MQNFSISGVLNWYCLIKLAFEIYFKYVMHFLNLSLYIYIFIYKSLFLVQREKNKYSTSANESEFGIFWLFFTNTWNKNLKYQMHNHQMKIYVLVCGWNILRKLSYEIPLSKKEKIDRKWGSYFQIKGIQVISKMSETTEYVGYPDNWTEWYCSIYPKVFFRKTPHTHTNSKIYIYIYILRKIERERSWLILQHDHPCWVILYLSQCCFFFKRLYSFK